METMTVYEAIGKIAADVDAIAKTRENKEQKFNFRGIDDVYNSIHPLFARHAVFSVPTVLDERTEERISKSGSARIYRVLKIKYTFYSADGTSVDAVVIGEGMDSGDKASNKAMAVAHKYAICQILSIPTSDDKDPDAESHEVAPKNEQQKTVEKPMAIDRKAQLIGLFKLARPQLGERYNTIMAQCEKDLGTERAKWSVSDLEIAYTEIEKELKKGGN